MAFEGKKYEILKGNFATYPQWDDIPRSQATGDTRTIHEDGYYGVSVLLRLGVGSRLTGLAVGYRLERAALRNQFRNHMGPSLDLVREGCGQHLTQRTYLPN